jgi:2,4-dienoyl-CoA reductase-like NADH-dependent reductase (Old Yellow Enzyme family)
MTSSRPAYRRIAQLKAADDFRAHLESLGVDLPFDEQVTAGPEGPLYQPYRLKDGFTIGNRFCIHPMEGWDGTEDGKPSELTFRRWRHFGESGAKLIWGGEATAVRHDGRANPNQLVINPDNLPALTRLRQGLVEAHEAFYGSSQDLLVGLQLTHSGRYSRPNRKDRPEPVILYRHPYLDRRLGLSPDYPVMTDDEIQALIACFIEAAVMAAQAGFSFVDLKHCHGYLGHEFLSAATRPGPYGGSFENRTRFLREIVEGIRQKIPSLRIGVRLSAFDTLPFRKDPIGGVGVPETRLDEYSYWFGAAAANPLEMDLQEPVRFLALLAELGIEMVNLTAGSPYTNPHIQRPALFPPSDGYLPPEDPLVGVARQVMAAAELKRRFPNLMLVGTGYSYLQEWLPNVAQYQVRTGRVDLVGLGRMVLAYPQFPADVLAGRPPDRKRLCRTFSDCTTAPRLGLVSGCYPLDDAYKDSPQAEVLAEAKARMKE